MLAPQLERAGILVGTQKMPWSRQRAFDRDYAQAMTEIDATVARLRARGATRIVIGGHSLGAAAALIFCAQRPADGLLLLALGHSPQARRFRNASRPVRPAPVRRSPTAKARKPTRSMTSIRARPHPPARFAPPPAFTSAISTPKAAPTRSMRSAGCPLPCPCSGLRAAAKTPA
ncbi:MAG: alpha/beta fold hydrolase [Burkholderiales bacterium]|nr:alpha/beta fold hydrolase [Burkholderiales bacterium]